MGLCIDADETPHNIDFELRRESVIFRLGDVEKFWFEVSKEHLRRIVALCNDPDWTDRLCPENPKVSP